MSTSFGWQDLNAPVNLPSPELPLTFEPDLWFGDRGVVNPPLTQKKQSGYGLYIRISASPLYPRRSGNKNYVYIRQTDGAPKEIYRTPLLAQNRALK